VETKHHRKLGDSLQRQVDYSGKGQALAKVLHGFTCVWPVFAAHLTATHKTGLHFDWYHGS